MDIKKLRNKNIDKIRKNKMGTLTFYIELLFSLIGKGNVDMPSGDVPEGHFYYATNKIFTTDKVMKAIFIQEFPMHIDRDIYKELRDEVDGLGELRIVEQIIPYKFDRDSWKVRNRILMWKNRAKMYEESLRGISDIDEIFADEDEKEIDQRTEWMIRSWDWVNKSERSKLEFCKYMVVLELISDNLKDLYEMEEKITRSLRFYDIYYKGIFVQTNEYYKVFSPCGGLDKNLLTDLNNDIILTDYEVSELFYNDSGLVGDSTGVYLGTDVFTGLPVQYDLKKGSDAVNFLVSASTGEGKSNYIKGLMTHLVINNLASIIVDYEGDEYTDIGIAHGAKFVNMNPEVSYYFDTTEIGDLTGDPKIDIGLKEDAISTTKLVFDVLTDYENGMNPDEVSLFNDMILRVYEKRGVTDDPNTWVNSKGASYEELYRELSYMRNEKEYENKIEAIDAFDTKLRLYFDGNIYSGIFKNRLSINDLLGHERVIFSFGMRGRSENTIDKRALSLRQLFVGYIIQLISNYNKTVLNRLTVIKLEELQRYLTHEASGKIVNDIITGGRKRGIITFLITNSPLQIIDTMDGLVDSDLVTHAKAIKNNINGLVIGRLQEETSKKITEVYPQLKGCEKELDLINTSDEFKYCFLLHYKGENSVVKFEIPPSLIDSAMYKTRDDQKI